MSDQRIVPGDLVRIVFACCATLRQQIGIVATVEAINPEATFYCPECGFASAAPDALLERGGMTAYCPTSWLIKINPPAQSTEMQREKEMT